MSLQQRTFWILVLGSTTWLAGCDQQTAMRSAPPAGTVAASVQPMPDQPLFGASIVKSHDVLPHAKADTHIPLPPAAPLPQATAITPSSSAGTEPQGGGVNPAAGMAAGMTDSKGAQHDADGK
jgi:hypothetical protein